MVNSQPRHDDQCPMSFWALCIYGRTPFPLLSLASEICRNFIFSTFLSCRDWSLLHFKYNKIVVGFFCVCSCRKHSDKNNFGEILKVPFVATFNYPVKVWNFLIQRHAWHTWIKISELNRLIPISSKIVWMIKENKYFYWGHKLLQNLCTSFST